MQRVVVFLFFAFLAIVPAGVQMGLASSTPRLPAAAEPRPQALVTAPPTPSPTPATAAGGFAQEAQSASSATDKPKVVAASAISQGFSLVDSTYNLRGLWVGDPSSGALAKLDSGPVPRQSVVLPVLMYHHVQPIDFAKATAFASDLTLPPTEFEKQLRYLRDRGFQSASLADLVLFLQGRKDLPRLSVVLTFDDGYFDNYLYAFPLLARYGFSGTFFAISSFVGLRDYATWGQLREMSDAGMEIGSHTVGHPDLSVGTPAQRDRELTESKRALEDALGASVRVLSYPGGAYNQEVVTAAKKAGYAAAVTTRYGATSDAQKLMELPRVRIHGTDTAALFRWRIEQYLPAGDPETR